METFRGDRTRLTIPAHAGALLDAGPAFLTKAFRAFGSLPGSNRIERIASAEPFATCGDVNFRYVVAAPADDVLSGTMISRTHCHVARKGDEISVSNRWWHDTLRFAKPAWFKQLAWAREMAFDCVARTHPGSVRELNEDAILNCGERALWAVADGMGGHDAGEVASAMVIDALSGFSPDRSQGAGSGVVAVLRGVNDRLQALARAEFGKGTIGSTVVGLFAEGAEYTCFWAGDSRVYLARSGELRQISRDHSLVQDLADAGMLEPAEAETHPNANVITRAVGAAATLKVDTVSGELRAGDLFLLASDGLTKLVSSDELHAVLGQGELKAMADRLIDLTLERGAPDNVSVVLVRVNQDAKPSESRDF